jgi:hypothetical protein
LFISRDKGKGRIYSSSWIDIKEIEEILGRDITLEDVILSVIKTKPKEKITNGDDVRYGDIVDATDPYIFYVVDLWEFGKPLHEQSEETIKELNKLIN